MTVLKVSSLQEEGVLQVSKWLKFQVLLDEEEMVSLLETLDPIFIAVVSEAVGEEDGLVQTEEFLNAYRGYVQTLKAGTIPEEKGLRRYFSAALTRSLDALYRMRVGTDKYLIKPIQPIIQLQGHQFFYSTLDEKFHPMVLSQNSVSWGVQFAYPQLYQDPKLGTIAKVAHGPECPNTSVFTQLTRWMRDQTLPTPFIVNGKRTNSPIRLGKRCLSWIAKHPQLIEKGIGVAL
jgi:hypothetical protein